MLPFERISSIEHKWIILFPLCKGIFFILFVVIMYCFLAMTMINYTNT